MTPEQASLTADIFDKLLSVNSERRAADLVAIERKATEHMADMLAVIEELRALSAHPCVWRYEADTLHASNPGGDTRILARVPGITAAAGCALAAPGEWIQASSKPNRGALDKQCRALAKRLADRRLHALAEAVRSIRLKTDGAAVMCVYDPDGIPLRVE